MDRSTPLVPALKNGVDEKLRAALGRATGSLSLGSLLLATTDWAIHLLVSQRNRSSSACARSIRRSSLRSTASSACSPGPDLASKRRIEPPAQDRRFDDEAWLRWPYNVIHQSFLLTEKWVEATRGVFGVERHYEQLVSFATRQFMDVTSPANLVWTNPVALRKTVEQGAAGFMGPAWQEWLRAQSAQLVKPPPMGIDGKGPLEDAPGRYVLEK